MPAKTRTTKTPKTKTGRALLRTFDPVKYLFDEDDVLKSSHPWQQFYEAALDDEIARYDDSRQFLELLRSIDNCLIEDHIKIAGFRLGFEVCRLLMLGELDARRAKGGAR
jgi:hypothetical protein